MIIGEVGKNFLTTEKISYLSNQTFLDFDLVILDLNYLSELGNPFSGPEFVRRKNSLKEFITHKKIPLVVIMPTRIMNNLNGTVFHTHSYLPTNTFNVVNETGNNINIISQTLFTDFFKKYLPLFKYQSYIVDTKEPFIATILTPMSKKMIACYSNTVVFIPTFKRKPEDEASFFKDLYSTVKQINIIEDVSYPDWVDKYFLPSEKTIVEAINSAESEISRLTKQLEQKQSELKVYNSDKILLFGTGDNLENKIADIFKEIGFTLLSVENNRDDLIVENNDRVAVVEIKGVSGSAAEKHSAQLEKWVASYVEQNEKPAKGILIVNAFKDDELSKRGDVFPHQMLKYSTSREHCLLSATQLLGMYYDIKNNPSRQEELINSLFDTVGIYQGYNDWKNFIEH